MQSEDRRTAKSHAKGRHVRLALSHVAVILGTKDSNTEGTVTASPGQGWVVTYSRAASKACWGPNAGEPQS